MTSSTTTARAGLTPPPLPPNRNQLSVANTCYVQAAVTSSLDSTRIDESSSDCTYDVATDDDTFTQNTRSRLRVYWQVINRRRAIVIPVTVLIVLLIVEGTILTVVLSQAKRTKQSAASSLQQQQLNFKPSTNTSTYNQWANITGNNVTSYFYGSFGGSLFSGEMAYMAGGPLTGLTLWIGYGFSLQATHGSKRDTKHGRGLKESIQAPFTLNAGEDITNVTIEYNMSQIYSIVFITSLPRTCSYYTETRSNICGQRYECLFVLINMKRLLYISGRSGEWLDAIGFTYITD